MKHGVRKLWDTKGDRSALRKMYHDNAMLYEHFLTNQVKPIETNRQWEQLDAVSLQCYEASTHIEKLLASRRTIRSVSNQEMSSEFIAKLLQFCAGVSEETDDGYKLFTYPSPGATYATTVFITVNGWKENYLYRYNPYNHTLEYFKEDVDHQASNIIYDKALQSFPVKIFLASDYQLIEEKYGEMGYRLLLLEMGHIAQNISLYSFACGYHSVCLGGYNEPLFKKTFSMDHDLHYVVVVG